MNFGRNGDTVILSLMAFQPMHLSSSSSSRDREDSQLCLLQTVPKSYRLICTSPLLLPRMLTTVSQLSSHQPEQWHPHWRRIRRKPRARWVKYLAAKENPLLMTTLFWRQSKSSDRDHLIQVHSRFHIREHNRCTDHLALLLMCLRQWEIR